MGVLSPEGKGDAQPQGLSSLSKDDCLHDSNRHTSANPPGQAISPPCLLSHGTGLIEQHWFESQLVTLPSLRTFVLASP